MKKAILTVFSLLLLVSCYTENKGRKQTIKFNVVYPTASAQLHAMLYPTKDSTGTKTLYLPGKTVEVPGPTQYIHVNCDSAVNAAKNNANVNAKDVQVPRPKDSVRVDTFYKTEYKQVENTAKVDALQGEKNELTKELAASEDRKDVYFWWAIISTAIIAITVVLRFVIPKWF